MVHLLFLMLAPSLPPYLPTTHKLERGECISTFPDSGEPEQRKYIKAWCDQHRNYEVADECAPGWHMDRQFYEGGGEASTRLYCHSNNHDHPHPEGLSCKEQH